MRFASLELKEVLGAQDTTALAIARFSIVLAAEEGMTERQKILGVLLDYHDTQLSKPDLLDAAGLPDTTHVQKVLDKLVRDGFVDHDKGPVKCGECGQEIPDKTEDCYAVDTHVLAKAVIRMIEREEPHE